VDEPSGGFVTLSNNHALRCSARVLALVVSIFFAAAGAAGAATRQVAPVGVNVGGCTIAPCQSMAYAYGQAAAGDTVAVAPGAYGEQRIPGGSKAVRFQGQPGTVLHGLYNDASNVTFDGFSVDMGGEKSLAFGNSDGANVTFSNGSIGGVTDEKGALITGRNFTFDRVVFHDVVVTADDVHNECVYALDVTGMTVRNSHFYSCATMDLFFTYGTWWNPLPPPYTDITIENNVFEHTTTPDPGGWQYYSLYIGWTGNNGGPLDNWKVRYNTFEIAANVDEDHAAASGSEWVGNLGSWNCVAGMAYRDNVGHKCGASDRQVKPESSSRTSAAPFGWINPAGHDFRLSAGSPAIDAGDPGDAPATDLRGVRRDARPDAGAFELGDGPSGVPVSSTRLFRFARLKPKTICLRARKHCPGSTRLRVGVMQRAHVSVRVKKLKHGARHLRTKRSFRFTVTQQGARRIDARQLGRGTYRVVVRAQPAGSASKVRTLKLRVR
jgi:hypothetical protein